jgi:hypothetical protein
MENQVVEIEGRLKEIEERNRRVEADKAWETSKTRSLFICLITYIIALTFMASLNTKNIFFGALVPVIGFYLSTQSLPLIKSSWMKRTNKL